MPHTHRFPTEFPAEEAMLAVGLLRGERPPTGELVEAGWWVAGYALAVGTGHDPHAEVRVATGPAMTREQAADALEDCCEEHEQGKKSFDLARLLKIAQVILSLLGPLLAGGGE